MSKIRFIVMILMLTMLMAGCGNKKTQEIQPPASPQVGIIDISAAVKAHPKYKALMVLEQQASTMAAGLEAQQLANSQQVQLQNSPLTGNIMQMEMDELNKAFAQEYNTKMSAKQREVDEKAARKGDAISRTLSDEFNTYNEQLEKEYQPQIFNLQLKLKIVQLGEAEAAVLQGELEKLQAARLQAVNLKHEQLSQRMNELMAPEKAILEQEVASYSQKLNDELAQQMASKQTEILTRGNDQHMPTATMDSVTSEIPEQLAMKQQEIDALQGFILDNITEQTAKVATQGGLEMVLTHVVVNVSAVDITTQVITECNK